MLLRRYFQYHGVADNRESIPRYVVARHRTTAVEVVPPSPGESEEELQGAPSGNHGFIQLSRMTPSGLQDDVVLEWKAHSEIRGIAQAMSSFLRI
jgi:hypothetical protein